MTSHFKLSAWYHQLAQQLEAGLPLVEALRLPAGMGVPALGPELMAQTIEAGGSIDDALASASAWLPKPDRFFLAAAAKFGRLPRTLHNLAARHDALGAAKQKLLWACAYPVAVLHLGMILFPILGMIDWQKGFVWDAPTYVFRVAAMLVPFWGGIGLLWFLTRRRSPAIFVLARMVPLVRQYVVAQSLADFAFALGNALEAGVPIGQAWTTAGSLGTSSRLRQAANAVAMVIDRGEPPGPKLGQWPCFPPEFIALYRTGETTGQLDQNLLRLAAAHQDRANRALKSVTVVYPTLLFLIVAGMVAYRVISLYAGYLHMIEHLAD